MADGIVKYILTLGDQTKSGARSAAAGAKRIGAGFASAQAAVLGFTAAFAGVAGTAKVLVDMSQGVADLRNDITDAATRSGVAAETLQGLRVAAEGSGLAFGALTSGLDQFGARIDQASKGGNDTARAFQRLGVDVKDADGNLRSADGVLKDTLSSLNGMEAGAERSALAVQTLGRSGGRLLQALSGSELEDFVGLAKEFGVDVGPEAAKSAGEWQRAIAELDLVMRGLKGAFVDTFGIGADTVFEFTSAVVVSGATLKSFAEDFEDVSNQVVLSISSMFDVLGAQFDRASARIEGIGITLGSVASAVGDFMADVATRITEGDFLGAAAAAQNVGLAIGQGLSEGMDLASSRVEDADEAFRIAAEQRDAQFAKTAAAFDQASTKADAAAGQALRALERSRGAILAGGGAAGVAGGAASGLSAAAGSAKLIKPGQSLDDVAAELDRLLAEALSAQGGLDAVGQVITDSLESIGREAKALITEERVGAGVGIGQSFLSGNVGGGLAQVGNAVGGTAGARLGTAGAIVGGLQFIGEQGAEGIKDTLNGVKDGLVVALEMLPELIGKILPDFAVALVADLIPALIKASPEIFRALILELPQAIGEAVAAAIGVESETGKGALRGASLGAAIGGVAAGVLTLGVGAGAGAAIGGTIGAGIGATSGRERDVREGQNARTAAATNTRGAAEYTRTEDRASMLSLRPRRQPSQQGTTDNPFDALAIQFDRQMGRYGRFNSPVIREA